MIKIYAVKRLSLAVGEPPYCRVCSDTASWYQNISNATFFELVEDAFVLKNKLDENSATLKHCVLELKCVPTQVELYTKEIG